MKNIFYSIAVVVTLLISVMFIGSKLAESYRQSCADDYAKLIQKRKELNDYAKWFHTLTPQQQDSVKMLHKLY